jgi:DNA modification methylase
MGTIVEDAETWVDKKPQQRTNNKPTKVDLLIESPPKWIVKDEKNPKNRNPHPHGVDIIYKS